MPPPPTSRVAILVEPLEAEVVVAVSVPVDDPVLEVDDVEEDLSVYSVDAVICWEPMEAYEYLPPVKTADEVSLPVNVTTAGLLEPLPVWVADVEAEDASEVAAVLSEEDCAWVPKARRAATQRLRGNMLRLVSR